MVALNILVAIRSGSIRSLGVVVVALVVGSHCGGKAVVDDEPESSIVGQPCIPTIEEDPAFTGFRTTEIAFEQQHASCEGEVCVAYAFQGRVSCPKGQSNGEALCSTPSSVAVVGEVCGQCSKRPAEDTVHCTCRCGPAEGQPPVGPYCTCPEAFSCVELQPYLGQNSQVAGKYCVKKVSVLDSDDPDVCGKVIGHWGASCDGLPP